MIVSVIIPVYNVSPYISRCLHSVLAQTYKGELECILVDDCTPDDSMKIVHDILSEYQGDISFKLLKHEKNKGLSAARNTGIRHADGDYLYFLDSDDAITPECIEILTTLAKKYEGVDIIQENIVVTDPEFTGFDISSSHFPEYIDNVQWIRKEMLTRIPMTMWNKLIRKDLITEHNLWFKENIIHEDEHWRMHYHKQVSSFAFCTVPTYYYYKTKGSITQTKYKDRSFHTMLQLLDEFASTACDKQEFEYLLWQVIAMQRRTHLLQRPNEFEKACRALLHKQLLSTHYPLSIRFAFAYLLYHSCFSKQLCRLFAKKTYKMIKQIEQCFLPPQTKQ